MTSKNEIFKKLFSPYDMDEDYEEIEHSCVNESLGNSNNIRKPRDGEVWMLRMPYFNFVDPSEPNDKGSKWRRCVIFNDSDYGLVAISCKSYKDDIPNASDADKKKGYYDYDVEIADHEHKIFSKRTYFEANDFRKIKYCKINDIKPRGRLSKNDYIRCKEMFEKFKKDRYKSIYTLMDWLKAAAIDRIPKHLLNTIALQSPYDIEKSGVGSSIDICTLFMFVANKYRIRYKIIQNTFLQGVKYFYPIFIRNKKFNSFRFMPSYQPNGLIVSLNTNNLYDAVRKENKGLEELIGFKTIENHTFTRSGLLYINNCVNSKIKQKDFVNNISDNFLQRIDDKMDIQEAYDKVRSILNQQKDSTDHYMESVAETVNSISKDSNIFFSEKDIYCNFWPFEQKKTHFCFVVGFSGSGKTTLARHLAKNYDAEWVELDTIMYDSKLHKMTERFLTNQKQRLLAKYIRENHIDLSHMAKIDRSHMSHEDIALMIETGRAFVEWLTTKNTERCVISGLDLIDIIPTNPAWYGAPIVFKGTSRLHSMYRRLERNRSTIKNTIQMIPQLISWYKSDAHGIDYIRSMTIDKYNYQERDELGELKKIKPGNISSHHSLR